MATKSSNLLLLISVDGEEHRFEVAHGKKIILGRAPSCQLILKAPNISAEHLEIYYSGAQVRVKDLSSANGTFRLPAKAPFVEALLSAREEKLELLLAKSPLRLSWSVESENLTTNAEKTVPLREVEGDKQKTTAFKPPPTATDNAGVSVVDPAPRIPRPVAAGRSETPLAQAAAVPARPRESASLPSLREKIFPLLPSLISVLSIFVFCAALQSRFLGALVSTESGGPGVAWDEFVVWFWLLHDRAWMMALVFVGTYVLVTWAQKKSGLARKSGGLRNFSLSLTMVMGIVLFPWIRLAPSGLTPGQWPELARLTQFFESPSRTVKEKHAMSKTLLPKFKGSSYFYVKRMQVQMRRVLEECGGAGEKAWEAKKVCLLLLHAVGIENLEEFAPTALKDTAYRASLILSLDGIVRVLASEGKDSKTLGYFLNSLSLVGLENERAQIASILYEKNYGPQESQSVLQELRQSLEERSVEKNQQAGIPPLLRFSIPSPIELGI